MSSDKLYVILSFSGIPVGGTQTLPHGLKLNGQILVPDFVAPQYPGDFAVVSATSTDLTLQNISGSTGACLVWCFAIHPVARSFGAPPDDGNIHQHMTPQPFVIGSPGGGGGNPGFNEFNVKNYGAKGDGVHNDGPAINQAITDAAAVHASGAFGAMVIFPQGVYLTDEQIIGKNGVGLWGQGPSGAEIKASSTFNFPSLFRTDHQDGTQEFSFINSIQFNGSQDLGAICSTAVVDFSGVFITSYMFNVLVTNGSSVGLRVACQGSPGGMGPIRFDTVWSTNNIGDNVVLTELPGNTGAGNGLIFTNLVSENQGPNAAALRLVGNGHVGGWSFNGIHIEMGGSQTGRKAIVMDGVPFVIMDNVQLLYGGASGTTGITITNNAANVGIQIRNVTNNNLIDPVLQDQLNGVTLHAVNIRSYNTPDVALLAQRFFPLLGKSIVAQDATGTERTWFDGNGSVTGESFNGSGLDVVADLTNNRAVTMADNGAVPAARRVFGFEFPDASNFRLRYFNGGFNLINFDNSGNATLYQNLTLNALGGITTANTAIKGTGARAAAPSTGTHVVGEVVFNADPIAGGFVGWVCVTAGTPGTWKSFGAISA